jgi:hypothetical protein
MKIKTVDRNPFPGLHHEPRLVYPVLELSRRERDQLNRAAALCNRIRDAVKAGGGDAAEKQITIDLCLGAEAMEDLASAGAIRVHEED